VLQYFVSKPAAVADLEDISAWRLLFIEISRRIEETHEALEWLVDSGYVERIDTLAAPPLFRLNAARVEEAQKLLDRWSRQEP
jgi:hypothetical protein